MSSLTFAILHHRPDLVPSSALDAAASDLLGRVLAANHLPLPGPANALMIAQIALHGLLVDRAAQVTLSERGTPEAIARRIMAKTSTRRIVSDRTMTYVGSASQAGAGAGFCGV